METIEVDRGIREQTLEGKRVILKKRAALGQDAILLNCDVLLRGEAFVAGARLIGCRIIGRDVRETPWKRSTLEGCTFIGSFSGNRFLSLDGDTTSVRGCDLSLARFDGCDFDAGTLSRHDNLVGPWPSFVVENPYEHRERIIEASAGTPLKVWARALAAGFPGPRDVVFDAATLASRLGGDGKTIARVLKQCGSCVRVGGIPYVEGVVAGS